MVCLTLHAWEDSELHFLGGLDLSGAGCAAWNCGAPLTMKRTTKWLLAACALGWAFFTQAKDIEWVYRPQDAPRYIAQQTMPVHLNLWLFEGPPPKNGQEVEVVLRSFRFTPE